MVKGFASSGLAFLAVWVSKQTAIEWLQILSLFSGLVLCFITITEKVMKLMESRRDRREARSSYLDRL
jgi:hypothetical protein